MKISAKIARFTVVGAVATGIHMFVGVSLITNGVAPLVANAIAFLVAFLASFAGHFAYTFSGHGVSLPVSLSRFLLVALASLSLNELILAVLVGLTRLPASGSLVLSTACVAVFTFMAGRGWAFSKAV